MDVVYTFGHSVDVDGDEWIDLGPLRTACDVAASPMVSPGAAVNDEVINNPFSLQAVTEPDAEPEQPKADLKKENQLNPEKIEADPIGSCLPTPAPVSASMSKAARSKEDLMAFYLGRAKQMEAKHKKIIVSPTQPTAIHSVQNSERPARIGI
ncbi:hypothetical protein F441_16447 [Phytophthora nicotianae CJ01A1]|uniref:Uncharacterized protein n=6 Tax=Phytophthora nicotianae TaxID=4792 RepID=W2PS86_PHYN3|nr:hypothetical protein PPTG_15835 [Phytophthora nicotianae INRA-310]ETI37391.1 hypothetical protein F443_16614 [Phytophthora nicotianae P1569]ETK77604.1 hypothetical protein L915_16147 [Phytophthora nicotianae]ETO66143.1 hypothetical protein F444_16614 [Phytophthora nicotianae P1976]ETP07236.1 hypothetical protein F441_16447 [Phytophthora nicotianae CJ01A1]ETP35313.1 hypothetical protein F442_16465 [Phytophthora nicotianae P10297]